MFSHIIKDNKHFITWKSTTIPKHITQSAIKYAEERRDFSPQSPKQEKEVNLAINYNPNQILAIVRISNLARIVKNSYKLHKEAVIRDIIEVADVMELSHKYDLPPLNILYIIFDNKYGKTIANRIFKSGDISALNDVSTTHKQAFFLAERHDASGLLLQRLTSQRSKLSEDRFIAKLRKLNIALKTEDDLKDEGSPITPDILFIDEVYINDVKIFWIDYKDYVGTDIAFIWNKNKAQTKKYNDKWGYGALCFSQSFVEELRDPSAILLAENALTEYIAIY